MQKIENLLLTAFDATEIQRDKSPELNAAYEAATNRWEVAIRYVNQLERVMTEFPTVEVQYLIGNYAILRGEKEDLIEIATRDEVLYMEAAKRLFFFQKDMCLESAEVQNPIITGLNSICLTRDFGGSTREIYGEDVYVAYLDTGIDFRHPQFISEEGESRIEFIWDQTIENGFFSHEDIQAALEFPESAAEVDRQKDLSGHGTHVAAIGSGNSGVASGSRILVVKLGTPAGGGAKTTELMRGVDACVRYAVANERPLALNISYGTNYGSHNGEGILEQYLSEAMGYGRNVFVVGAGNEGVGNSHFRVGMEEIIERSAMNSAYEVEFSVGEFQQSFSLQIWKEYQDDINIYIRPAGVEQPVQLRRELELITYPFSEMDMLVYYGEPSPFSVYQEIYLDFIPKGEYLPAGIWKVYLEPVGSVTGSYIDMWLPVSETLEELTGFLRPSPETTITIPSTSNQVISVGAFDQRFYQSAAFSGRGYTWATNQVKPEIAAPGVNIVSASPGGGYVARSGTSMAAPFVTGAAALFLEWGIVLGQDDYLYGEKVKAYLIKGARPLSGIDIYPNPQVGWGILCIRESLPN